MNAWLYYTDGTILAEQTANQRGHDLKQLWCQSAFMHVWIEDRPLKPNNNLALFA
jgi:hypothetical protein